MDARSLALLELGRQLLREDYRFVTVTPETHRRISRRAERAGRTLGRDLRDVFGFSRPFERSLLPAAMFEALRAAEELDEVSVGAAFQGKAYRALVRFSRLDSLLLAHSAFPTTASDAVFFGPDTYRFARLLAAWAPSARRAIDIGCGSGAGGLSMPAIGELWLTDVNDRALRFAAVNAALNERRAVIERSDVLHDVPGAFDLIVANPPYLCDRASRVYRHGGGAHGEALSVRIAREAVERLAPGGTLVLYTGAAIVAGEDMFARSVLPWLRERDLRHDYEELDPDVFGEELDEPGYHDVERIAAIGLRVRC